MAALIDEDGDAVGIAIAEVVEDMAAIELVGGEGEEDEASSAVTTTVIVVVHSVVSSALILMLVLMLPIAPLLRTRLRVPAVEMQLAPG